MNKILLFPVITFLLTASLVSCDGSETPGESGLTDTLTADTLDESEKIIEELNKKIAEDPNNPNHYHERAYVYYRLGNFEKALLDADRCILIDSTIPTFHFTKGEIYFAQLKAEEAIENYKTALRQKPDYWEAELRIGRIYMYLKNWPEAMKRINSSLKMQPTSAEAYFMKGEVYEETGDTALAASSFQTATEQDPQYYDAFIRLGLLYAKAKSRLALDYYNTALNLRPNSIEALYNKAIFCQENGMENQALQIYDQIISLKKDFELAYYNKGYIFLIMIGDYQMAAQMFREALKVNPRYIDAYHNLGLSYEGMKDYKKARENFKKALEIDPSYELSANSLDRLDRMGL